MKNIMSSRERINNLINYKTIDRVPFISCATMYSGYIADLTSKEFYFDIEKSFYTQKSTLESINCDGSPHYDLPGWIGLDFGAKFDFQLTKRIKVPTIIDRPIKNLKDIINFKLPNPEECKAFNDRLKFYKIAHKEGLSVSVPAGSPFEISSYLMEPAELLKLTRKDPTAVDYLLKLISIYLLKIADIYIENFGIENCSVSSTYPFESNDLISHKTFESLILPHVVWIHEQLLNKNLTSFSIHLCGDHKYNLPYFKEIPLPDRSSISVDEKINIIDVADTFGEKYVICGNVPTSLLVSGSSNEVYYYTKTLVEVMKHNPGGFILMPSCDLAPNTKPENLNAMYKAAIDYGSY